MSDPGWPTPLSEAERLAKLLGQVKSAHRGVLIRQEQGKRHAAERDALIPDAIRAGATQAQIAELLGVSRQRVNQMINAGKAPASPAMTNAPLWSDSEGEQ